MEFTIFLIAFALLLISGLPIYIAMIVPSILYVLISPDLTMNILTQKMLVSLNSFPIMAVPFFVLAGTLMSEGSVSRRIFNFARNCVGHHRGGLSYVNILASVIFSGMSGSAIADVGGLGQVEMKEMRRAGYPESITIGITAASSTIGPIIPPSIPFVIFASYASVSVGALFMGGFLPGLLIAIVLGIVVFFVAKKENHPKELRATWKERMIALKDGILAFMMPVIIIGGIWTGWFTATEAALVSIVYALIISLFVFKDYNIKQVKTMMLNTAMNIIPIMLIIIGAMLFSWILTYEKIDGVFLKAIMSFTSSKYVVILIICLIVTVFGMFFDPIVAVLLLVPMLLPICNTYGINVIHLGVIITLGNMIALMTPPVGLSLYTLQSVTGHPFSKIVKYTSPWLIPLFISWLIVAFCEPIVMLIPNLMGIGS